MQHSIQRAATSFAGDVRRLCLENVASSQKTTRHGRCLEKYLTDQGNQAQTTHWVICASSPHTYSLSQRETHLVCRSCSAESATKAFSVALHSVSRVFHLALSI